MIITIFLFIIGLVLLIKGGDWFVDGSVAIAKKFRIPDILIGATIVSIGTTLPEVMVSATSALSGHGEMAYGNALGSIICNAALIAAITIAIRPSKIDSKSFKIPTAIFFVAAAVYVFVAYFFGEFSRGIGLSLLAIFVIYMLLSIRTATKSPQNEANEKDIDEKPQKLAKNIILLILGAALIALGANLLVNNGTIIAGALGVPESVIALTFVAIGTSLPELVTAITSIVKGHGALSLGNVIGANILNLVLVSGVASAVSPFPVPNNTQIAGINSSLIIDIPVMLFVMAFLTLPALVRGKLSRWQGIILLATYVAFCATQFVI